jgi:serine/threonine protein kinase
MVQQPTLEQLRKWDPERIGPYAILGRLGAGAMGRVYLGRSTAGRLVAVKTIKIELAEEAGFRDHFAHEVAAARRVSGMFTAAVVAADPDADVPWLATAYVAAPSLSQLVRACGPQPVATIRWLAAGCAEALESIHVAGLVHRDLKPSNVLVAPDGPRVIDFGVARAAERIQLTVTRGAVGTPAYMAPEQARDTRQASTASDVFALGATLLFAATGHAPYQGETVMDVLVRLATEPPDLTGLPAELAELIAVCLERSPRVRPTSAALLEWLGPFAAAPSDTDAAHSYLTEPAMALIKSYGRNPQLSSRAASTGAVGDASPDSDVSQPSRPRDPSLGSNPSLGSDLSQPSGPSHPRLPSESGEDGATFASHLVLPSAAALPAAGAPPAGGAAPGRRWPRRPGRRGGDHGASVPGSRPPGSAGRPRRLRRGEPRQQHDAVLGLAARAAAAVVLVGAGAGLGVLLNNAAHHGSPSGTGNSGSPVGTLSRQAGANQPGLPPVPPSNIPVLPIGVAAIGVIQPFGDGATGFVLHGTGWQPGSRVTIALAGIGVAAFRPVIDRAGSFNYTIDQDHAFFPGLMPPGVYHVQVTGPGGRHATTHFLVNPGPPPGAAPSGPPPGTGSPGSGPPA